MDERSHPDRRQILDLMAGFMPTRVVGAAAEPDQFIALGNQSLSAEELAERLGIPGPRVSSIRGPARSCLAFGRTTDEFPARAGMCFSPPPECGTIFT
jgi:hypothetical protein